MRSWTFGGSSLTFWLQVAPPSPSVTVTLLRLTSQTNFHPVLLVRTLSLPNVSRSRWTSFGTSRPRRALLMLFLLKMFPKLPDTTSGVFLARIAVAACSRELPQPKLKPDQDVAFAGNGPEGLVVVLHADLGHLLDRHIVLVGVLTRIDAASQRGCPSRSRCQSTAIEWSEFLPDKKKNRGAKYLPKVIKAEFTARGFRSRFRITKHNPLGAKPVQVGVGAYRVAF